MFVREPIVLWLSLPSGFSDTPIFTFLDSYGLVSAQWDFGITALGLTFIPLLVGYFIAYFSFSPVLHKHLAIMHNRGTNGLKPEARLWWLLFIAPLKAIGLFGFAWTGVGPPVHWIAPLIFSGLVVSQIIPSIWQQSITWSQLMARMLHLPLVEMALRETSSLLLRLSILAHSTRTLVENITSCMRVHY